MNRTLRRILALVPGIFIACLLATTVQAQGLVEVEPNNTFGTANGLALNGVTEGTINPGRDADWFEFVVDQHGELRLNIGNVAPELAVSVRVWNGDKGTVTGWYAPLAKGGDTEAVVDLPAPGRYLLEVAGGDAEQQSGQPYALRADFTPSADNNEPNNNFGSAALLTLGAPVAATLLPAGDADWFAFDVDEHGELRLLVSEVAEELAVSVRVWNVEKSTLTGWFAPLSKGGDTEAIVDLPAPGRYYLEVVGGDNSQRSIQPFSLLATYIPSADIFEPNNSFGTAAELTLGVPFVATLLPARDADWFTFDVDRHGELRLKIGDVAPELAVSVRVWNSDKGTLTGWFAPLAKGGDTVAVVDLPAPGRYLLEIVASDASQRTVTPFTVEATFTRAIDAFELNNRFGDATPLNLDVSAPINLLPGGDADWFAIDAPHHGELLLQASEVPETLAISMRVWNAEKNTITGWFAPLAAGGNTDALVDLPAPGRYYIEVAGGDSKQRDINAFLLSNRYRAAADQGEPNDTFETATPVDLDNTYPGNILPAGDRDWCELVVDEAGELHIVVTNAAPELAVSFRLWDAEKRTISDWFRPLNQGGDVEAIHPIAEPGMYYVEVVDNDSSARSIQPYLLRFSMQPIDPTVMVPPADVPSADVEPSTTGTLDPAGGEQVIEAPTASLEGVRLRVPADALPPGEPVELEVGLITNFDELNVDNVSHPELGALSVEGTLLPIGPVVNLEPNGLVFQAPVEVEIPIDPDLALGASGYWLILGAIDDEGVWTWELMAQEDVQVDSENGLVMIQIPHLAAVAAVGVVPDAVADESATTAMDVTEVEVDLLKQMIGDYIAQYQVEDACFSRVVSLGDPQRYADVLDRVQVRFDPAQGTERLASMSADGSVLTLQTAPIQLAEEDLALRDAAMQAVWVELTHALEVENWDRWTQWILSSQQTARAGRNTDYMRHAVNVLEQIQQMEAQAREAGVDPAEVQARWPRIRTQLESGSANTFAPVPDLDALQTWTGFVVDLDAIEELYRSNECGPALELVFAEAVASADEATVEGATGEPYGVFQSGEQDHILIGQQSVLLATPACDLRGWPADCAATIGQLSALQQIFGPFDTQAEAEAAFCADLAADSVFRPVLVPNGRRGIMGFDGQEHWISNVTECQ